MTDIFISYSRKDVAVVSELARTLEELGYSVWWDIEGLHGGQPFANVIEERLSEAKCAIVLWSPDSVKSKWVQSEASFADERGILVTAVYRDAKAPMPFNNRHNESLRNWNGSIFDEGFQKLLKAVNLHCPEPLGKLHNPNEEATVAKKSESKVEPREVQLDGPKLPSTNKLVLAATIVTLAGAGYYFWSEHVEEKTATNKIYKLPNNLTLLPIPSGSFMMGGNNGQDDEKPVHKVTLAKPFWMSKTEITFDQYERYAKATGVTLSDDEGWGRGTRPVINVSWHDAQSYVKWLSGNNEQGLQCRLPSEAEWEYAARSGTTTQYSWGDQASHEYANYGKDESPYGGLAEGRDKWVFTAPVASFPVNRWGLHDMHGNVWEWVQDSYSKNYEGAPVDGSVWEGNGSRRVIRGGSWYDTSNSVLSVSRSHLILGNSFVGFRVVCSSISK